MLMDIYILDNTIIFSPLECSLTSVADSSQSQSLSEPASRCFEKLLISGELISHDELYELGWAGRPITPSPNTLYQTISSIRRCFKALDPAGVNPVLTETRKGFRINPELRIKSETINVSHPTEEFSEVSDKNNESSKYFYTNLNIKIIIAFALSFLIIVLTIWINSFRSNSYLFEGYHIQHSPTFKNCNIFISDSNEDISEQVLRNAELNCTDYPYNYITKSHYHSNISTLSCAKEIKAKKNNCHIVYLRGMLNE